MKIIDTQQRQMMAMGILVVWDDDLTAHPIAEILPPMTRREFDGLEEDIRVNGQRDPIAVFDGKILDGMQRYKACFAADIVPRTVTYDGDATPQGLVSFVLSRNLHRRHFTSEQRACLAVKADELIRSLQQAAKTRREHGRCSTLPKTLGKVSGTHQGEVTEQLAKTFDTNRVYVAEAMRLKRESPAVFDTVLSGRKKMTAVIREKRTQDWTARRAQIPANLPKISERYRLYCSGIANAFKHIAPESVDYIITDPPYAAEFLPRYGELGQFAQHALKPGGSLVCMTGVAILPDVFAQLSNGLTYQWTLCYQSLRRRCLVPDRKVRQFWKPVVWFVKGQYAGAYIRTDVIEAPPDDGDKDWHSHGQSVKGMERLVDLFTMPGQIVCDPFCGGGATGIAAVRMNRFFIGLDIEQSCIDITAQRLDGLAAVTSK